MLHVVRVVDLQFGGEPFWAHFDGDTGLLVREEFRNERGPHQDPGTPPGPYLHLNYLDYGSVGEAHLWRTVERHDLHARRYARRPFAVSYAVIDDGLFARPEPRREEELVIESEIEATLWVEVRAAGATQAVATAVLAGGEGRVLPRHGDRLREQLEQVTVEFLRPVHLPGPHPGRRDGLCGP